MEERFSIGGEMGSRSPVDSSTPFKAGGTRAVRMRLLSGLEVAGAVASLVVAKGGADVD